MRRFAASMKIVAPMLALLFAALSGTAQEPAQSPAESGAAKASAAAPCRSPAKTKKRRRTRAKPTGPRKVIVRNGGTEETGGSLSPALGKHEAELQRTSTDKLLQSSDESLKAVSGRQLTSEQASTVQQVNAYMQQSRSASEEGDFERAHNLALKARLLSDTLPRR
jgi:hypothetical protein